MKRLLIISAALVVTCVSVAAAQSSAPRPLAEVAKAEEARRKEASKPAKVITNNDLKPDISKGIASLATAAPAASASTTPANATAGAPAAAAKPEAAGAKDQAYWAGRMKDARDKQQRLQMFADSLQTRINSLTTDFINRDDPAQKAKIETDRKAALAELERVKKEMNDQTKAIAAIEEEARRAGVPAGWLR